MDKEEWITKYGELMKFFYSKPEWYMPRAKEAYKEWKSHKVSPEQAFYKDTEGWDY